MAQPLWALPAFLLGHAPPVLPTGTPRQPDASPGYLCLQSSLPLHASASSFLPATSCLVPSSQELVPGVQLSQRRASPGHGEALGWTQERRRRRTRCVYSGPQASSWNPPEELRHKRRGVAAAGEGRGMGGRKPGREAAPGEPPRCLGPGSKACVPASETAPPPVFSLRPRLLSWPP